MNRREMIKGIAATGAIAVLPQFISANSSTNLPFHFIGLGGAGCNGLQAIHNKNVPGLFTCITHPVRTNLPTGIQSVEFNSPITEHALPEVAFAIAPPLTVDMHHLLSHNHHYVLLAGLGGYTGTKLLQAFTQLLQQNNQSFTVIASLPFTWETGRRKAVEQLLPAFQTLSTFHLFDLTKLSNQGDNKKMKMNLFFQMANEQFYYLFNQHYAAT